MKNMIVRTLSFVVAVVIAGSALTAGQGPAQQGAHYSTSETSSVQVLTGTLTCTGRVTQSYRCQRNQTLQTCTLACVELGSKYVLKVGDKPYILEGNARELEGFAGGKATVTGLVSNGTIQVRSVSDSKHN